MFCDTYTQRHKTLLCHFSTNYFVNIVIHPTARCALLSFYKKYIVNHGTVFRKNGVVVFIALTYLCHIHIF